jgi:hypothetical protein
MSTSLDDLTAQALSLPLIERVKLVHRLRSSVEEECGEDEALFAEIARRDAEMEAGTARTYSHDELIAAAQKAIGK